jgi:Protein of unknown function (DUF559)/Transcriptional regulator, AbiEi antitoxin
MDGKSDTRERDRRVAEIATRQRGLISSEQLLALGLGYDGIEDWVRRGRLHRVHRGVYAVGHAWLSIEARWLAAVLACGPSAVLSHRAAASLWGLRASLLPRVEVSVPRGHGRRTREGILVHRTRTLRPVDVTVRDGIAVTTVARTLVDLAEVVPMRSLERAADQAETERRFDLRAVEDVIAANPRRIGCARVRRLLDEHAIGSTLTRSGLEERMLEICRRAGIERPAVNARVADLEVDFLWMRRRLVAEADSRRDHATRRAFERDRERDAILLTTGFRVVRFTERRIVAEPAEVAATLRRLLAD